MSIVIGADIVPTESNKACFDSGDMQNVVDAGLLNMLSNSDYRIFNLECPLVDTDSPIRKCGPNLRADVSSVNGLKSIGIDLLTLANNHIMDQGNAGLESTIKALEKENIAFLGVGKNRETAAKPFVFSVNDKKIGVYACAEHEFSIASENISGANPFDPLESFDHVLSMKKQCDYVIVLYHGGKEYYCYPSPFLQKVCRKFVEKGADLVVCQHSHCIGCEEKYMSGTIVYGQGNFVFESCKNPMAGTSILIIIDKLNDVSYVPLVKSGNGVYLASDEEKKQILSDFYMRSEQIKKIGFIESEYSKFAKKMLNSYLQHCSGYYHKIWQRILNKICKHKLSNHFGIKSYKENELLALQNFIECESHRELLVEGLKHEKK